jgi:hypothetical protein
MGGILVGVLAADAQAHQIQDLIIVVLPVCPVQAQSRRCFWEIASERCAIGMTGLTSCVEGPDLEPFRGLEFFCGRPKKSAITLVGASLLAMDVNDNACLLDKRVALRSIASKLAPTNGLTDRH